MKVFISVPMKGRSKNEIERDIDYAKKMITLSYSDEEIEFINTMVQDKPPYKTSNQAIWYLGKAIELLSQCDMLVCFRGAENIYSGCFIEKEVAQRYGLKVVEV